MIHSLRDTCTMEEWLVEQQQKEEKQHSSFNCYITSNRTLRAEHGQLGIEKCYFEFSATTAFLYFSGKKVSKLEKIKGKNTSIE